MTIKAKRVLVGVISAVLLVAVLVCTCPLPKRINVLLQGNSYTDELERTDPMNISITGYRLDWLFFDDRLKISVQIENPLTGDEILKIREYDTVIFPYAGREGISWSSVQYYSPQLNRFEHGGFAFDSAFETVVLEVHEGPVYLASSDADMTLDQFVEMFDFVLGD